MFRIEITADTAVELISGIRGLAGAMSNPEGDVSTQARVLEASTSALAVAAVTQAEPPTEPKTRKPRAKKDEAAAPAETTSDAPADENSENSSSNSQQIDIEEAIAESKQAEPAADALAVKAELPADEPAADEPAADEPFTMTKDELKTWIIRDYLNAHLAQPDRPVAFKAVMTEVGIENFTAAKDEHLPMIKAVVDRKIAEAKGGK